MTGSTNYQIEVTGRHAPISERMREHALEKLQRLGKYHPKISRIELVADEPHEAPEVEVIVHVDSGSTFVAKDRAESFSVALDHVMDKISKQLRRSNSKRKDHHHETLKGVQPPFDDRDD